MRQGTKLCIIILLLPLLNSLCVLFMNSSSCYLRILLSVIILLISAVSIILQLQSVCESPWYPKSWKPVVLLASVSVLVAQLWILGGKGHVSAVEAALL